MHIDERGSLGEQPRHQQKRQERQAAFVDEDAERIHLAEPNSAGQHRPREVSSATSPVLSDRGHNSEIGEADGRAAQRKLPAGTLSTGGSPRACPRSGRPRRPAVMQKAATTASVNG